MEEKRDVQLSRSYADPGWKLYPLNTKGEIKNSWNSINDLDSKSPYSSKQMARLKTNVRAAAYSHDVKLQDHDSTSNDILEVYNQLYQEGLL